ncbi:DUF6261 family protein [Chryseobacterium sp.]|uniref:DUF6261 family protein n=1 Tax=Chryseobacterium sp. TaxID=1871047 RepID=UPI00289BE69C|nr:DUF6261 family protein [Chryseobacterium sp.]
MKITLKELSTKNLATLTQRVINLSRSGSNSIVSDHVLLVAVENLYNEYDKVYSKPAYSGKGKEVANANNERNIAYRNMKAFLNGYRRIHSAPNSMAAVDLYAVFKKYGLNIDSLSYSEETAQMRKLIQELESSENLDRIVSLSITSAFDDLLNTQTAFENLFAEQVEANAELRLKKSATELRRELEKALRDYINLVTAMKNVSGWDALYFDLNEIVKAARNSTLGNDKENLK